MQISKTLYVAKRDEWRQWLKQHYKTESDIWLVYYRKDSGKPRVAYDDAVEEALCFGWIDSTMKKIDDERFAQRFSPRKSKTYSQPNRERLKHLIAAGKVMPEVLETIGDLSDKDFKIPTDILKVLKADKKAWQNFQRFPPTYQRIRIAFIDGARNRPEEFQKRLTYFIKMSSQNRKFGYGIKNYP